MAISTFMMAQNTRTYKTAVKSLKHDDQLTHTQSLTLQGLKKNKKNSFDYDKRKQKQKSQLVSELVTVVFHHFFLLGHVSGSHQRLI